MIVALATCFSCKSVQNFTEPNFPEWTSTNQVQNKLDCDSTLLIVSFNIEFALRIEEAITELSHPSLANADIILLQEMDEEGTILIADKLDYNYVFYPISFHPKHKKNFGNSVLSKWPIIESSKIILANAQPLNKIKRSATSAVIKYGQAHLKIYSIHMETFIMFRRKRLEQLESVLMDQEKEDYNHVILGGDFNSIFKSDLKKMVALCTEYGLTWASQSIGSTTSKFNIIKPRLDHFFTREFDLLDAGKMKKSSASDHLPVWVKLKLK